MQYLKLLLMKGKIPYSRLSNSVFVLFDETIWGIYITIFFVIILCKKGTN